MSKFKSLKELMFLRNVKENLGLVATLLLGGSLLAVVSPDFLLAQSASQGGPPNTFAGMLVSMLPMFIMVYFIFYMMVTRPHQMKLRDHAKLIEELKRSDTVVTSGGLIGKVSLKESDQITLDSGSNMKVKVEPSAIVKRWVGTKGEVEKAASKS